MIVTIGARLGPYEIQSALGAGGMGEVYRARDTRLDRTVAIKILPDALAADSQFRDRFDREARTISQLDHPHICALYDVGEQTGTAYLVMQYLEGETLADRLTKGALPLDQALQVAIQIADALGVAHRAGIVHRDLKPGNIILTKNGAKLLDFGLAKTGVSALSGRTLSMLPTTPPITQQGSILGTFQYMAPEQLEGREADARTDIFAFGAVVYEMLTGRKAFDGKSQASLISSIMSSDPPPISTLQPLTPPTLDRIVRKCLAKDPDARWHSAHDLHDELVWVVGDTVTATPPAVLVTKSRGRFADRRERFVWAGALLLCIAAAGALLWRTSGVASIAPPREMRVELTTPPTYDLVSQAISPDGETLAFVASSNGRPMLWLRSLATGDVRPLTGSDGASFPFWSPDSRSIGFFANERLYRIDSDGGSLTSLATAPLGTGGTWSRDGVVLFTTVPDAPISRVSAAGGHAELVPGSDQRMDGNRFPQFLPDGRHYLYFMAGADVRGVYAGDLTGTERRRLFDADAAAVFVPPAHLLFVRAGTLFVQGFNTTTLNLEGDAAPLTKGVTIDSSGAAAISASSAGSFVYRIGSGNRQRQLAWFDRHGAQVGEGFPPDFDNPNNPAISPDGRQVVLSRTVAGNADVWLQDLGRLGALRRITTAPTPEIYPIWSPDGTRVAYAGIGPQGFDLFVKPTTTQGEAALLLGGPFQKIPADWSRDGRFVLYRRQDPSGNQDLWALSTDGSQKPFPVAQTSADERAGQFSPDGKWVAIESNESGHYDVYVQAFPSPAARTVVSTGGGRQARWGPDGKEVFYIAPDGRLMVVSLRFRPDGQIDPASPVPLFTTRVSSTPTGGSVVEYDVSKDGKRFLMNTLVEQAGAPITLVLNPSWARRRP